MHWFQILERFHQLLTDLILFTQNDVPVKFTVNQNEASWSGLPIFLIFEIVTSFVQKYAYYEEYGTLYPKLL